MSFALAGVFSIAAVWAAPEGQIAYLSGTEQEDLCVVVLDVASGETVRVGPGTRDGAPRWSPDAQWLAFLTHAGDGLSVCVVRPDGSERRVLEHQFPWNGEPRWAPDSRRLTYTAATDTLMDQRVTVYDLENNTETFWGGETLKSALRPVWLPKLDILQAMSSSDQVTYQEHLDVDKFFAEGFASGVLMALGLALRDGGCTTEPVLITQTQATPLPGIVMGESLRHVEWMVECPRKGSFISFETNDGGDREVFALGKRGLANLTNDPAADWNPVWSYEGRWIAFESFRGGRRGIYRVFPETARVFPVIASDSFDCWAPTWAPGSEWLAFVSDQTGDPELFVCDPHGENQRRLTEHPGPDYAPAWRPRIEP